MQINVILRVFSYSCIYSHYCSLPCTQFGVRILDQLGLWLGHFATKAALIEGTNMSNMVCTNYTHMDPRINLTLEPNTCSLLSF